jgi:two-component system chemotaxis response regulator CheY
MASPPIQLILSDLNMPECTGMDLLKRVRADAKFAKVPFILVTSEAEKQVIVEAVKLGVSNYVTKPLDAEALRKKLEAVADKLGIK